MQNVNWDDSELSYASRRNREVFARYGLAMHNAQCLEKQICILLALAEPKFFALLPTERDKLFDFCLEKTMGSAWKKLKRTVKFSDDLLEQLDTAKNLRNRLAHNYFWLRAIDLTIDSGQELMISELTEMADYFSSLDDELTSIAEAYGAHLGITDEFISKSIERVQAEYRRR